MYRSSVLPFALLITLAIAACGSPANPAPTPATLAQPTASRPITTTSMLTTTVERVTPAEASVAPNPDWTQVAAVEGDYYVLGNPAAPVRLIDYSDFL